MVGILVFIVICTILGAWAKGNRGRESVLDRGFKVWNFVQSILFIPVCIVVGAVSFYVVIGLSQNSYLAISAFSFASLGTYRVWSSFWDILWGYINR